MTASELFGLDGQVAVVTGGSRGIGRAIAAGFAEAGTDVVIASRKLGNCAAAAEISASTGRMALGVEFHAGRWDDCDRLIEVVYGEFGRCEVLVNNAGMSPLYPDLASVTEEYYDKVQGVNLKGPFRDGPAPAGLWPPPARHVEHRQGAAGAGHGSSACAGARDVRPDSCGPAGGPVDARRLRP